MQVGRLDTRTKVEYSNAVWLMQTNDEGDLDEIPSAEASLDQGLATQQSLYIADLSTFVFWPEMAPPTWAAQSQ